MLIDNSYFTRAPRHILNASVGSLPNPNAMEVMKAIDGYIASYQEEYLRKMLGDHAGSRINAYFVCMDEEPQAKKIEAFEEVASMLRESFADYIFFKILAQSNTQAKITGLMMLKSADAYVSPVNRQVQTWNRMVVRHRQIAAEWEEKGKPVQGIEISKGMLKKINSLGI